MHTPLEVSFYFFFFFFKQNTNELQFFFIIKIKDTHSRATDRSQSSTVLYYF
jgi:hypothetical protein